jgi:dolichyl-phosphate-mannose-protein mannosyltransferase
MSSVAAVRSRAVSIPAWVWLAGIVLLSAVARIALGRRIVAPWIIIDEIVYSELAKSFAAHGHLLVRDVPTHDYGFVYPVLIAPAWRLFAAVPDAYRAAKGINGVLMSLAAVPAYFLGRRVLSQSAALVVALLTVLVPSMLYTGTLMTENAFYPLFVVVALALVATLERPTIGRQLFLLALCGLAYATRAQAAALVPAIATAPIVLALVERRGLRGARPFATLYGIMAAGVVVALLATLARGRSPLTLLGAYRTATSSSYSVGGVLRFFVYHVAEFDLYVGIVPFAALVALWLGARAAVPAARAFAAGSAALCFWLLAEVATFASQPGVDKIEERNMFYLAPLAFTALLAVTAAGIVPRRRRSMIAAATVAAVLPVFVPYAHFITTSAIADTFALLPWWWVQDHGVVMADLRWVALAVGVAGAALFLWLPRRLAPVIPALLAAYFLATSFVAENGRHGIHKASLGKLWAGIQVAHPDWIDRAVGRDPSAVAVLYGGSATQEVVWENEFFNRSVGRIYDFGAPPDPLPTTVAVRRRGGVLTADGRVVRARYVLADGTADLKGSLVARDGDLGVSLFRVDGPIVLLSQVHGLYPNDTWSGREVTYRRYDCPGGRLSVLLGSDASLYKQPQTVVAYGDGRMLGEARITPTGRPRLTVPMHPDARGVCTVRFEVGRTKVPGGVDTRALGAHFLAFDYRR